MARLVSVAVPVPFLDLLTYRVPEGLDLPQTGARVVVPLGSRVITGCVVAGDVEAPQPTRENIRDVIDVLDADAYVPPTVVELALWVAEYYAAGPGEAVALCLPPYAKVEGDRLVSITDRGLARAAGLDERQRSMRDRLLRALADGKAKGARQLAKVIPARPVRAEPVDPSRASGSPRAGSTGEARARKVPIVALIRSLEREGLVTMAQAMRGGAERHRTVGVAALTVAGLQWVEGSRKPELGGRQRDALEALRGAPEGVPVSGLADRGIGLDTLKRLARRELVALRRERVERDPFAARSSFDPSKASGSPRAESRGDKLRTSGADSNLRTSGEDSVRAELVEARTRRRGDDDLTPDQQAAVDALAPLAGGGFHVALLHGVTGSGKTEVYLRLTARTLASGRAALVLVPEIALTPAVASLFRAAFGGRVAIQHSGLSDGERYDQWHRIRRGDVAVVVGTRSAVFAPLANIGLIVVDEEHDSSYKQDDTPRYNGRDVAVMRGKMEGALVVLGSATPSMESFHNALTGRYVHVSLPHRVLDRPLADVQVVNMRDEYAAHGPDVILSETLKTALERRLRAREQALVLLNRRGIATAVFCRQCGATLECPNCSLSLIVHAEKGVGSLFTESAKRLPTPFSGRRGRCHYCNYSRIVPKVCEKCAGPYLEHIGVGTVRVEEEIATLWPGARVARLDRDAARRRGAIISLLDRFGAGEIDILVGTQMIAKGHDFPRVTLVGVISADVGLGLADFRAAERTFQLLTQVAGRAGRGARRGEAIVQTLYPEHYSIRLACRQDYRAFFDEESKFRTAMRYPPVVSLINTIVRAPTFSRAMQDAEDIAAGLRRAGASGRFRVLGPATAPLGRLRGEHRVQFFLKGARRADMRRALMAELAQRPELRRRVTVDVDPMNVL